MRHSCLGLLAAAVAVLVACSAAPNAPDPTVLATARILAIPEPMPEKYRSLIHMRGWQNPYLIIRADGVALLDPDYHLERILKPGELTQALGNLPPSAWPYGRVVAVTENAIKGSADDEVKIRANRAIVAGTLESMHVLINWVPSA
jgi:hypothetical protein